MGREGWNLPVLRLPQFGNVGPGFGYGIGCGVGIGAGIIGGHGIGGGFPGLYLGWGLGAGCGIGFGYGYGIGRGRSYDQRGTYSNFGQGLTRRLNKRVKNEINGMYDTEFGRMIGDLFQDLTNIVANFGRKDDP